MNKDPSCKLNGHGWKKDGSCLYCDEYKNAKDPWADAKYFRIFGYSIPVIRASADSPRNFYTELHQKDGSYLASMGSDKKYYWLAAVETYFKRGKIV